MMTLSPYLLLDGTCKPAMEFYRSCLGGELSLSFVGETPMKAMFPPDMHNRVINAHLQAEGISLSASDWMLPSEQPVLGNTICLFIRGLSPEETRSLFDKLSDGASVTDPLSEQPFGLYGALNDKFGFRWMFHCDKSA